MGDLFAKVAISPFPHSLHDRDSLRLSPEHARLAGERRKAERCLVCSRFLVCWALSQKHKNKT
jgi:hypothetical protein